MKNVKLAATLGACALVGAVGIGSTFAYLTANTNEVKNTFTIGSVHFDKSLTNALDESKAYRDKDGMYMLDEKTRVAEQTYTDILPGEEIAKDPTIHMGDDSEMAWVFAEVKYDPSQVDSISYNTGEWSVINDDNNGTVILAHNGQLGKYVSDKSYNDSVIFETVKFKDMENDTKISPIDIDGFAIQASAYSTPEEAYNANVVVFEKAIQ